MNTPREPVLSVPEHFDLFEVEVARPEFSESIKFFARVLRRSKCKDGVSVWFDDGFLFLKAGESYNKMPARGEWFGGSVIVSPAWILALAKNVPPGDPVRVQFRKDGRLYANSFSAQCRFDLGVDPWRTTAKEPAIDENWLIHEAAFILKPLLVETEELEKLVGEARSRATVTWTGQERDMIGRVAKAWALLAPLGVETADLRRAIDKASREAWKRFKKSDEEKTD